MVGAEAYWIQHAIPSETRVRVKPKTFENRESNLRRWMSQREQTLGFLRTLTPEMRAEPRPFPWDPAQATSVDEIVWHVVAHEQYHHGQVFTRLGLVGGRDLPDHDLLRENPLTWRPLPQGERKNASFAPGASRLVPHQLDS